MVSLFDKSQVTFCTESEILGALYQISKGWDLAREKEDDYIRITWPE